MLITLKMLVSKEMLPLDLQFIWNGCSISFWTTMLTPIIELQLADSLSDSEKLQKALYGLVALGVGEVLGGLLHGLMIDKIGSRKAIWLNILIICVMFASTIVSI
jgi:predicted MFS family arabinose efflux permease